MEYQTTFGRLPIGTTFERSVWTRNTTGDRRRKSLHRWQYTKTTHGDIAGHASGAYGAWRFDHSWPVYVDGSDLRLLVTILRAQ